MTASDPLWLTLLRAEAGRSSIGLTATRIGYSRTTISLVLAGKYPGSTQRVADAVLASLAIKECPHLQLPLADSDCRSIALAPAPTHHPMKLGHWRACQRCPNRPKGA